MAGAEDDFLWVCDEPNVCIHEAKVNEEACILGGGSWPEEEGSLEQGGQ